MFFSNTSSRQGPARAAGYLGPNQRSGRLRPVAMDSRQTGPPRAAATPRTENLGFRRFDAVSDSQSQEVEFLGPDGMFQRLGLSDS